jgi:hypothetical protein
VFFESYVHWFVPERDKSINPEDQPRAFLGRLEKISPAKARKGLMMAVNDVVEMTLAWDSTKVAQADAMFTSGGTFTLSEVRQRFSNRYEQIRKRGRIRNETDCYLAKGLFDGGHIEKKFA